MQRTYTKFKEQNTYFIWELQIQENLLCLMQLQEQEISIVSDIKGTTTDSVKKAMELIPFGPVLFIDTAGFNDDTELGKLRIEKTLKEIKKSDFAIYVIDGNNFDEEAEKTYKENLALMKKYNTTL